ncbi:hypothetical protein VPH35_030491 [Triticum aestivum]
MVPRELNERDATTEQYNTLDNDDHDFLSPEAMTTTTMARGKGSISKGDLSASLASRSDPIRPGVVKCTAVGTRVLAWSASNAAAARPKTRRGLTDRPTGLHGD